MRELTLKAGVSPEVYEGLMVEVEDVGDLWGWLEDIFKTSYKRVHDVWRLHPPARWAYYDMIEADTLNEYVLLQSRLRELERVWRESGFKKKKRKVQPERTGFIGEAAQ